MVDDFMAKLSVGAKQLQTTHSRRRKSDAHGCAGTWCTGDIVHAVNYIRGKRFILKGCVCVQWGNNWGSNFYIGVYSVNL